MAANLLAAHCLSGCDTVSQMFSIGKKKVVKVLMHNMGPDLEHLGDTNPQLPWSIIEDECIPFVCALYGMKPGESMITLSEMRFEKWLAKTKAKTMHTCLDLKYLPLTREALIMISKEHIISAQYGRMRIKKVQQNFFQKIMVGRKI